jgi:alpha-ribazole phosphatase
VIYLIRHPRPRDAAGRCYGRTDVEVDVAAVERAAASIRARIPPRVFERARIHSSPASRCLSLARALAAPRAQAVARVIARVNAPVVVPVVAAELAEMNFGRWEGLAWDAVPREELDAWAQDPWGYAPGGGESAADLEARLRSWLADVEPPARAQAEPVVAVTHAGIIRVALALAGRKHRLEAARTAIEFGSVHEFEFSRSAGELQRAVS